MRPPMFEPLGMWPEFTYTFIVVFLCFLVYFKTREMYNLTKYKGIGYFRNTFLFFGLAYASRFLINIFLLSSIALDFDRFLPHGILGPLMMIPTGYLSTLAIFFMAYSTVWKKIKFETFMVVSNVLATLVSIFAYFSRSPILVSLIQLPIIIFALVLSRINQDGMNRKEGTYGKDVILRQERANLGANKKIQKKKSHAKAIYSLITLFWFISLFMMDPPILHFGFKIVLQIISVFIFLVIFYRVSRWTK